MPGDSEDEGNELLKTIRIPKNWMYISNKLPLSNYNDMRNSYKRQSTFKMNRSMNPSKQSKYI